MRAFRHRLPWVRHPEMQTSRSRLRLPLRPPQPALPAHPSDRQCKNLKGRRKWPALHTRPSLPAARPSLPAMRTTGGSGSGAAWTAAARPLPPRWTALASGRSPTGNHRRGLGRARPSSATWHAAGSDSARPARPPSARGAARPPFAPRQLRCSPNPGGSRVLPLGQRGTRRAPRRTPRSCGVCEATTVPRPEAVAV